VIQKALALWLGFFLGVHMIVIDLLAADKIEPIRNGIYKLQFDDGKKTARGAAKDIKENFQITHANKNARPLLKKFEEIVKGSPAIEGHALPKQVVGIRISSYKDGGHYGWHVDMATMNGVRTDMSFTLFLTDKDDYEGGELQLDYDGQIRSFKGKAGQIVLYPTGRLHQVTPVTSGERLVVVGWINSTVIDEEDRKALAKMGSEISRIRKMLDSPEELNQLNYLYHHFRRRMSS
jgi:PKHD-type hydroxylase